MWRKRERPTFDAPIGAHCLAAPAGDVERADTDFDAHRIAEEQGQRGGLKRASRELRKWHVPIDLKLEIERAFHNDLITTPVERGMADRPEMRSVFGRSPIQEPDTDRHPAMVEVIVRIALGESAAPDLVAYSPLRLSERRSKELFRRWALCLLHAGLVTKINQPTVRVELTTRGLRNRCSTTELRRHAR